MRARHVGRKPALGAWAQRGCCPGTKRTFLNNTFTNERVEGIIIVSLYQKPLVAAVNHPGLPWEWSTPHAPPSGSPPASPRGLGPKRVVPGTKGTSWNNTFTNERDEGKWNSLPFPMP